MRCFTVRLEGLNGAYNSVGPKTSTQGIISPLTSAVAERLWIMEEQHGVLYAKIDLCDREVINSEESQMTSEQFPSRKQKMSYDIDLFLSLNPHSCKCRLINIGQAGAVQFVPHLTPKGRQLGKGKRNGVSWKKKRQPGPHRDTLPVLVWDSELPYEESA